MDKQSCNGLDNIIAQAIEEMKAEQGDSFRLEKINLAELGRRTHISRNKLRRWKENGFRFLPNKAIGKRAAITVLTGYTGTLDHLLHQGITNSAVCLERLQGEGYTGSLTTIKRYIASHRSIVPAGRHL